MSAPDKIFQKAVLALNKKDFAEAERLFRNVLLSEPRHVPALNLLTVILMAAGRFAEAEPIIAKAVSLNPDSDAACYNFGLVLKRLNKPTEALQQFSKALSLNPSIAETWNNRGTVFNDLKRYEEAIADFDRAISLQPSYSEAYVNKGKSLAALKRYDDALTAYDRALELNPDLAEAWLGRGALLSALTRCEEAFTGYEKALILQPDLVEAWLGRGTLLADLKRHDEAFAAYDKALTLKPDLAEAWLGRANASMSLKRYDEALAAYEKTLALRLDLADAWVGRGNVFFALKRYDDALTAYDKALASNSDCAEAWLGRAVVFAKSKHPEEAVNNYNKVLAIDPNYPFVKGELLHQRMLCCDWKGIGGLIAEIDRDVASGVRSAKPFGYQAVSNSTRDLRRCAEIFAADKYPPSQTQLWRGERYSNQKIRLGYLSGEFRHQATSILIAELFELHDKNRFELFAFDNGWDDGSEIRKRINKAFDVIIDIRHLDDLQAAKATKQKQIDILVNLNGYFGEERTGVFSRRPAPVQVSYLGFPGTMGASYIDYLIADPFVIPLEQQDGYVEKIAYLPDTYQVNDRKRAIPEREPTRAEAMLPQTGFIFCCFNNSYKITPEIFEVWMRLLHQVDDSTLWLLESNPAVPRNLRQEADRLGIAPERLVFAPSVDLPEHLARHRLAHLFLDTLPYNAHTTASDALWAGLPILTCLGETFPGRVAASLLRAVGLPELVTASLEDYEALALKLAREPPLLASIRSKLARNRYRYPLFDTERFTRHIEAAYVTMWERQQRGEAPQAFAVSPID